MSFEDLPNQNAHRGYDVINSNLVQKLARFGQKPLMPKNMRICIQSSEHMQFMKAT
jgi:hypothetical protein